MHLFWYLIVVTFLCVDKGGGFQAHDIYGEIQVHPKFAWWLWGLFPAGIILFAYGRWIIPNTIFITVCLQGAAEGCPLGLRATLAPLLRQVFPPFLDEEEGQMLLGVLREFPDGHSPDDEASSREDDEPQNTSSTHDAVQINKV